MTLKLHNTLTRSLDTFTSQLPSRVTMYTCGPTVYSFLHVGNWAAYIYWDTLIRLLQAEGYTVERILNITDVGHLVSDADDGEDKLEKGAKREGKTAWEVAQFYTDDFLAGMEALHLLPPTYLVKATDYIPQELQLIRTLKEKGYTYQIDDGIYFDTTKFPTYAEFAKLDLVAQKAGARVAYNEAKHASSDFALWKFTPAGQARDMEWETPADLTEDGIARPGFPGWHLECSAMALDIAGPTLDIHTGGIDHIPVHHTNEIAQSEAATGQLFSRFWLHNNHLKVNGTKISKSLDNGYTLQDLADKGFTPLDYRLFVLQSHYRSEGNFTFENLTAAQHRLHHWRNVAALRHQTHDTLVDDDTKDTDEHAAVLLAGSQALREALEDDLNTPEALTIVDDTFSRVDHSSLRHIHQYGLVSFLETVDELLGIELLHTTPDITEAQKRLILNRERAREEKDWKESDRLRDELQKNGITIRDTATGPIWEYTER